MAAPISKATHKMISSVFTAVQRSKSASPRRAVQAGTITPAEAPANGIDTFAPSIYNRSRHAIMSGDEREANCALHRSGFDTRSSRRSRGGIAVSPDLQHLRQRRGRLEHELRSGPGHRTRSELSPAGYHHVSGNSLHQHLADAEFCGGVPAGLSPGNELRHRRLHPQRYFEPVPHQPLQKLD